MVETQHRKRTQGPPAKRGARRELVRGEPVVQRVLAATLEQLARAGYKALRMEDVAASAGVNKTTVYRRWPEKAALVRDALSTFAEEKLVLPDTGSLRGDLIVLGRAMIGLFSSCRGQSVGRMLAAEGSDPEVADIKRSMRKKHEAIPLAVIDAAVRRGELAPGVDHRDLFDAFMGALHHKVFFMNEPVTDAFIERLVTLLLDGALVRSAPPRGR
jgi:AcrR family transcriptional regulator